jgi:hypothetical protein
LSASDEFAIVTRDETALESRLIHGIARTRGTLIDADDDCDGELLALCGRESAAARDAISTLREGRARFVASAMREGDAVSVSSTISVALHALSIVTTPEHLAADAEMLVEISSVRPVADYRRLPLVWRNGSGAVLMHEAVGHPKERGHPARSDRASRPVAENSARARRASTAGGTPALLEWPSWLTVETPFAMRRQSFTDIPLQRMTSVRVEANLQAAAPQHRIDILLVAGGRYEPLTDRVSLFISAADLIEGNTAARLRPFTIEATGSDIARGLRGASGEVRRYPGVICSKEGQELFVSSFSPDLVTEL